MLFEFCAENMTDVPAAIGAGAGRIELCDNLAVGGTTPSAGVVAAAVSYAHAHRTKVMCMIRPRGGGFEYGDAELSMMESDVRHALALGADGIVLGCLRRLDDGDGCRLVLDRPALERLAAPVRDESRRRGEPVDMTFHMAFDELDEERQYQAIDVLASLGFTRILTHGGAAGEPISDTVAHLRRLVARAGDRIIILPGGGITASNAADVAEALGVGELHGTRIVDPVTEAIRVLESRPDRNCFRCVIETLRLGRSKVRMLDPVDGVLTQLAPDGTYFAAPFTAEGARAMRAMIPHGALLNCNDIAFLDLLAPQAKRTGIYEFWVYPAQVPPDGGRGAAKLTTRTLTPEHLDIVDGQYDLLSRDEIAERLAAGVVRGGFDASGRMVGFIGEHEEASMGMLEVFPEARRHGYAQALEAALIADLLEHGRVPYCHVAPENRASQALQTKLGLIRTATLQCWTRMP